MEVPLRKLALFTTVLSVLVIATAASAQQADAMFGFGTTLGSGTTSCNLVSCVVPEKGGLHTNIGVDVIFHRRIGFGFDAAWRTSQAAYGGPGGQPYRPILFDFNGVYQPRINKKVGLDLMGGVGWQSTRFYLPYCTNNFTCNNYTSSNHFLIDAGAGLRYYAYGNLFIRPEFHYYHIVNNTDVFTNNNVIRVGGSIGYTIGGPN
jgi:hypothetical protein